MKKFVLIALAFLCIIRTAAPAHADIALTFTGGTDTANRSSTLGWQFTPNSAITINALGWWDAGADGLGESHQVGLWTNSGTLLATATVQSGTNSAALGPSVNGGVFRFELISPLTLTAGTSYVVGGFFTTLDLPIFNATSETNLPQITFTQGRGNFTAGSFAFPNDTVSGPSYFGPNFNVVPEPSTWAMLGLGAVGMGIVALRQRGVG